jgi:hypothetical protein
MKKLILALLFCLTVVASATTQTFYNPTTLAFEHDDYDITDHYVAEFWIAPATGQPLVTRVVAQDVPKSKVTIGSPGPPVVYNLLFKDIPVFLPFGKSYVLRLIACGTTECGESSEVTPEQVRYTYCKATPTSVRPLTIVQGTQANGSPSGYVPVVLTIDSVRPVTSISVSLVGSGQPAFYFTGDDMRNTITLSLGPLPRAGRYLMNISAADEAGCSASQASVFLTVR